MSSSKVEKFVAPLLVCLLGMVFSAAAQADDNWVYAGSGSVPADAISSGSEPDGTLVYVCRAYFNGGVHPGRVRPGLSGCDIGWGGSEQVIWFYEVLVPHWVSASDGNVPQDAYAFGYDGGDPDGLPPPLYACRANLNGGLQPGKVRPGLGGCSVGWGGREIVLNPYDVLIADSNNQLPVQPYRLDSGSIPFRFGPIVGGFEAGGQPLYVCLADFNYGKHPGKTRPGLGGCNIGWGGAEQSVPLQSSSALILKSVRPTDVKSLSFPAGHEANGDLLSICIANAPNGGLYPGKYSPALNGCSIGFNGIEFMTGDFTILTSNFEIPR